MRPVTAIILTQEKDGKEIGLINELASLQELRPTTAMKMLLREVLPMKIHNLRRSVKARNRKLAK